MYNDPVTHTASFFWVVMLGVSLTAADLASAKHNHRPAFQLVGQSSVG